MRGFPRWALAAALILALLAACAGQAPPGGGAGRLRAVLVLNGVLGDKSFADSAQRGMDMARDQLGIDAETIELGADSAKWQSGLEDIAATQEYDILIVGTFQMLETALAVAAKHPAKRFIIFDAAPAPAACPCPNVYAMTYKQNEGSYLAGLYAGLLARERPAGPRPLIGVVGGADIPIINDFIAGYRQGAGDAGLDPAADVLVQYAGSFNDPARGKEIARAMYQQGAAVVFNVAAGTGLGVFEAAAEQERWAIGVDSDQWLALKDQKPALAEPILSSMLKNIDTSLLRALGLAVAGELPWGAAEALGVAEGGVGLARNQRYEAATPAAIKQRIDQAEQALRTGALAVDTVFK